MQYISEKNLVEAQFQFQREDQFSLHLYEMRHLLNEAENNKQSMSEHLYDAPHVTTRFSDGLN